MTPALLMLSGSLAVRSALTLAEGAEALEPSAAGSPPKELEPQALRAKTPTTAAASPHRIRTFTSPPFASPLSWRPERLVDPDRLRHPDQKILTRYEPRRRGSEGVRNLIATPDSTLPRSPGTGRWHSDERGGGFETRLRERRRDFLEDTTKLAGGNQRQNAAAEPPSRHPCTQRSRSSRGLDREVDGGHRDLEVVTHGGVRGIQQRGNVGEPACLQGLRRLEDPAILGDDVLYSSEHHGIWQLGQSRIQVRHVPKGADSQQSRCVFTAGPSGRILAVHQGMWCSGVEHHQLQPSRIQLHPHLPSVEGSTVQEQGVTGRTQRRGSLIHQPGGGADEFVLRAARQLRSLQQIDIQVVEVGEGGDGGTLQRRRGRQPGAE